MTSALKFIVGCVILLFMLPVFVFTYYRGVQHYTPRDSFYCVILGWATDTSWAKGYRESKFEKVKIGMMQDEVRKIMGDPLFAPTSYYWGYTGSPSSTHYHQRAIFFSPSGSVTQVAKGFYFD